MESSILVTLWAPMHPSTSLCELLVIAIYLQYTYAPLYIADESSLLS